MIPHPNPITVTPLFDKTWITSARILIGSGGVVTYARYNGEQILNERPIFAQIEPLELALIEPILIKEAKRMFGIAELKHVAVQSPSPASSIKVIFSDQDSKQYRINSAVVLANTDVVFSVAFQSVMSHLGAVINN